MADKQHDDHIRLLERARKIRLSQGHLLDYIEFTMPDPEDIDDATRSRFKAVQHHRLLCEALERVERGECLRLAISIPPQHGKSETASRRFPAWFAGRNPHKNVMFATYNDTFAMEFGAEVREIMASPQHRAVFPNFALRSGSKAKDHLVTSDGGQLAFIGRGGSGTGKPADLFLIDDPLKNAEEAESPTIRRQLHEWFSKVAFTRCHAASAIVIIHTRWNEDDLIGRLCDPDHPDHDPEIAAKWNYINIPAVIEAGPVAEALGAKMRTPRDRAVVSQFGTKPMCALWPARFPLRHLAEAKRMNPRGFEALYQGRPAPEDGEYFKADWLLEYDREDLPKKLRMYGASDHAVTEKQENDKTVIGCVGVDERNDVWVLPDVVWERMETDRTVEELLVHMKLHAPMVWWMESELISKSFGPFLYKRMDEERIYCTIDPKTPTRDKRARARAIQGRLSMHKVRFPKFAPWWPAARNELLKFPAGAHDDFVDWLSWIGLGLMQEVSAEKDKEPEGKVVAVGSIAWIKAQDKRRRKTEALRKAAAGF